MIDFTIDIKHIEAIKKHLSEQSELLIAMARAVDLAAYNLVQSCREYDNERQKQNPYVVKRIIKHISEGLSPENAKLMTAKELGESTARVDVLFGAQKAYYSGLKLYARKYTAEKLKKAGFTASQIAKILEISENHVYKLLRCEVKI